MIAIIEQVAPRTMTSHERIVALVDAVDYIERYGIQGAVCECGVWRGGSMMAAALALQTSGAPKRPLYLYDTFDGMPEPGHNDVSAWGTPALEKFELTANEVGGSNWCAARLEDVRAGMDSTDYPSELIHYVPGKVENTIPGTLPDMIALLRLDTDWFESTRHELEHMFGRVSPGGIIIIDDYGHWCGARKAVDEFLAQCPLPLFLNRVDYTCRLMVKPFSNP